LITSRTSSARRALIAVGAALAVPCAAAVPADASLQKCVNKAPKPNLEVGRTNKAIVFDSHGLLYGCAYSGSKIRKLPGQNKANGGDRLTIDRGHVVLAEAYVAYASIRRADRGEWIYSVNVKTGKLQRSFEQDDIAMGNVVLKDNGSVAWMYSWHPERPNGFTKVMKIDRASGPPKQQLVDSDEQHPNDPNLRNTLRITQGGTHLAWNTNDGPIPQENEPTFE
jgi:hypothetical protein